METIPPLRLLLVPIRCFASLTAPSGAVRAPGLGRRAVGARCATGNELPCGSNRRTNQPRVGHPSLSGTRRAKGRHADEWEFGSHHDQQHRLYGYKRRDFQISARRAELRLRRRKLHCERGLRSNDERTRTAALNFTDTDSTSPQKVALPVWARAARRQCVCKSDFALMGLCRSGEQGRAEGCHAYQRRIDGPEHHKHQPRRHEFGGFSDRKQDMRNKSWRVFELHREHYLRANGERHSHSHSEFH